MKRKKIVKQKKALMTFNMIQMIPRLLFMVAVVLSIMLLVRMFIITHIEIRDTEARLLINRILFSPTGINYRDDALERIFPGIVDIEEFNDTVLNKTLFYPENSRIAAKLTLTELNGSLIKEAYFNKKWYKRWKPLAESKIPGPGGANKIIERRYVLVKLPPHPCAEKCPLKKTYGNFSDYEILAKNYYVYRLIKPVFPFKTKYKKDNNEVWIKRCSVYALKYVKKNKIKSSSTLSGDEKVVYEYKFDVWMPKRFEKTYKGMVKQFGKKKATNKIIMTDSKPAVYLYDPNSPRKVTVKIIPKGKFAKTIPKYDEKTGWVVETQQNNKILNKKDNKKYDYLFYETEIDNLDIPKKGYVKKTSELETFFDEILPKLSLNQKEIKQFKEYWIPKLKTDKPYYFIGLLDEKTINDIEKWEINPKPDIEIRIRFYFKTLDKKPNQLPQKPKLPVFTRDNSKFMAVEWGGFLDIENTINKKLEIKNRDIVTKFYVNSKSTKLMKLPLVEENETTEPPFSCYEPRYSPAFLTIEVVIPNR